VHSEGRKQEARGVSVTPSCLLGPSRSVARLLAECTVAIPSFPRTPSLCVFGVRVSGELLSLSRLARLSECPWRCAWQQVDSFTLTPFSGNPAAVLVLAGVPHAARYRPTVYAAEG
jgi:hypothetical protein